MQRHLLRQLPTPVVALLLMFGCSGGNCTVWGGRAISCPNAIPYPDIGTCPVAGIAQGAGDGFCYDDGSCNPGFACVESVCLPSGAPGEPCNGLAGANGTCNSTSSCAWNDVAGVYTCQSCGATIGAACCGDGKCSAPGTTCNDSYKCEAGGAGAPCTGTASFWVWTIDASCAALPHGINSDDATDAASCAADTFPNTATSATGAIGTTSTASAPTQYRVCATDCNIVLGGAPQPTYLYAFTTAQLNACEQHWDASCTWTTIASDGDCPP